MAYALAKIGGTVLPATPIHLSNTWPAGAVFFFLWHRKKYRKYKTLLQTRWTELKWEIEQIHTGIGSNVCASPRDECRRTYTINNSENDTGKISGSGCGRTGGCGSCRWRACCTTDSYRKRCLYIKVDDNKDIRISWQLDILNIYIYISSMPLIIAKRPQMSYIRSSTSIVARYGNKCIRARLRSNKRRCFAEKDRQLRYGRDHL